MKQTDAFKEKPLSNINEKIRIKVFDFAKNG